MWRLISQQSPCFGLPMALTSTHCCCAISFCKQRKPNLHAGLVILSKALVVVHVPLQCLLGVLPDLALLIIVTLLLGCFIPARHMLCSDTTPTDSHQLLSISKHVRSLIIGHYLSQECTLEHFYKSSQWSTFSKWKAEQDLPSAYPGYTHVAPHND